MNWILVTLRLYRSVLTRAVTLTGRNWPVCASIFIYWALMTGAEIGLAAFGLLYGPMGLVGGLLLSLLRAACCGSFLYLVEMMVRTTRVTLDDFKRSFTAYLNEVIGVMFILWMIAVVVQPLAMSVEQGEVYLLCLNLLLLVFLNAVPELIYVGHATSLGLLSESYTFIGNNWIEWFPPTLVAVAVIYAIAQVPVFGLLALLQEAVVYLLIYFTMVLRGLLFIELYESSARSRAFRYRAGS